MVRRARDTLDFLAVLAEETSAAAVETRLDRLLELPLESITRGPHQMRKKFDATELAELADSIRTQGVLQPIVVRPQPSGSGYELIAGERRWRASQLAGLSTIPALIREVTDEQAATLSLVENLQRSDLNPIEEAEGYQNLIGRGLSQSTIGTAVGKSVAVISRMLGLLKLAEPVREALREGQLSYAHGRILLSLPPREQTRLAQLAIRRSWSSRQLEQAARHLKAEADADRRGRRLLREDPDLARLRERIACYLATRVEFKTRPTGAGQLIIHYNDASECNGILEKLNLLDLAEDE